MFGNSCMFHFFPLAFSLWNFNSSIYGESPLTNDFLITCFIIEISLYRIESDAKRITKKGKRSQDVVKCASGEERTERATQSRRSLTSNCDVSTYGKIKE